MPAKLGVLCLITLNTLFVTTITNAAPAPANEVQGQPIMPIKTAIDSIEPLKNQRESAKTALLASAQSPVVNKMLSTDQSKELNKNIAQKNQEKYNPIPAQKMPEIGNSMVKIVDGKPVMLGASGTGALNQQVALIAPAKTSDSNAKEPIREILEQNTKLIEQAGKKPEASQLDKNAQPAGDDDGDDDDATPDSNTKSDTDKEEGPNPPAPNGDNNPQSKPVGLTGSAPSTVNGDKPSQVKPAPASLPVLPARLPIIPTANGGSNLQLKLGSSTGVSPALFPGYQPVAPTSANGDRLPQVIKLGSLNDLAAAMPAAPSSTNGGSNLQLKPGVLPAAPLTTDGTRPPQVKPGSLTDYAAWKQVVQPAAPSMTNLGKPLQVANQGGLTDSTALKPVAQPAAPPKTPTVAQPAALLTANGGKTSQLNPTILTALKPVAQPFVPPAAPPKTSTVAPANANGAKPSQEAKPGSLTASLALKSVAHPAALPKAAPAANNAKPPQLNLKSFTAFKPATRQPTALPKAAPPAAPQKTQPNAQLVAALAARSTADGDKRPTVNPVAVKLG